MKKLFLLIFIFCFLFVPFFVFAVGDEPEDLPAPDPAQEETTEYVPMSDEEIADVYQVIAETRLMLEGDVDESSYTPFETELLTTLGYIYTILLIFVVVLGCFLIYKFFNLFF